LPSAKKLTRPAAAGGGINMSIRKALAIVSAMMADDRFDLRIGP
jgi:hypothetical protein